MIVTKPIDNEIKRTDFIPMPLIYYAIVEGSGSDFKNLGSKPDFDGSIVLNVPEWVNLPEGPAIICDRFSAIASPNVAEHYEIPSGTLIVRGRMRDTIPSATQARGNVFNSGATLLTPGTMSISLSTDVGFSVRQRDSESAVLIQTGALALSQGDYFTCINIWGVGGAKVYAVVNDGALLTASDAVEASLFTASGNGMVFGTGETISFEGELLVAGIWDQRLSETQILGLLGDPYTMLREPSAPARRAQDILGLSTVRGAYIEPNQDPVLDSSGRTRADFDSNTISWPGGEPAPRPYFLKSRE